MMAKSAPAPPKGTGPGGARLWRAVVGEYELGVHEEVLLVELTRVVDRLDALNAAIVKDGALIGARPHPALVEARQLEVVLAKLVAVLRMPAGDERDQASGRRPQRRQIRGVYGVVS
jgi:hypothetical protein